MTFSNEYIVKGILKNNQLNYGKRDFGKILKRWIIIK
jgi:hypothetical protein